MTVESFLAETLNIQPLSFDKSEHSCLTYLGVVIHFSNVTLSPTGRCVMLPLMFTIGCIFEIFSVCLLELFAKVDIFSTSANFL